MQWTNIPPQSDQQVQQMYQTCIQHPSCIDCPYLGTPVQEGNTFTFCEIGIKKQNQNQQEE